jgi:hypothetical protein
MVLECKVLPPVKRECSVIESALKLKLPNELHELWDMASEVRLNEDVNYGQWGCVLGPLLMLSRSTRRHSAGEGCRTFDRATS